LANHKNRTFTLESFFSGFTLSEILVVTALMAILVVLGVGIFLSSNQFYQTQSGGVRFNNEAREAADQLVLYVRTAIAFVPSHVYNSVTYTTGANLIVLQLPSLDSSNQIIPNTYDYAIIGQDPNNSARLILTVAPDPASNRHGRFLELSNKLNSINLSYDNSDFNLAHAVDYQFSLADSGRFPASEQISGSVTLRNK
jgi:prepilin-type N-terminal cleavage/methylation domain-containing protein